MLLLLKHSLWINYNTSLWVYAPVVIGHGSCLQGLGCARVDQRTAPVVLAVVSSVCDMYDVITGHTQRWWVTVGLHVKIYTYIEGVSTVKCRR